MALKVPTVLVSVRVVPVPVLVVRVPVVLMIEGLVSLRKPLTVRLIAPLPVDTFPVVRLTLPVSLTVIVPVPTLLIFVTVSVPLLVKLTLPLVVLVALKVLTVLALVSVVPVAELVVSVGTAIRVLCVMLPAVLVRVNVPVPLMAFTTLMLLLRSMNRLALSVTEPLPSVPVVPPLPI